MPKRISDDKRHQILESYKTTPNCITLAKHFDVNPATVRRILKSSGTKLVSASQRSRKYTLNEHYFDTIDTEEKSYWLGLLYADGTVGYNTIRLELSAKDKDIVYKFGHCLQTNKPVRTVLHSLKNPNHQDSYELTLHSPIIYNQLIKLGCHQNKTFTLNFPTKEQVPDKLLPHFVRGYFDGDGCLTIYKSNGYFKNHMQIDSTLMFCEGLGKYLHRHDIIHHIYTPKKARLTSRQLVVRQRLGCYYFGKLIYQDATIFMARKRNKFDVLEQHLINANVIIPKL